MHVIVFVNSIMISIYLLLTLLLLLVYPRGKVGWMGVGECVVGVAQLRLSTIFIYILQRSQHFHSVRTRVSHVQSTYGVSAMVSN